MSVPSVSLVVPARNARATLHECLGSVSPLLARGELDEIVVVDDGSTDDTRAIAAGYSVTCLSTRGAGPGAARNTGWRASSGNLIWFIDSDCVAQPDTLARLVATMDEPDVAGVGGSYANAVPKSYLAWLIHEEIATRHARTTKATVTYLATYNVLYRRSVLESVGGFAEDDFNAPGRPGAEDADLSYRLVDAGHRLTFEPRAIVAHYHPTKMRAYARTQFRHGYWGARLYARHPGKVRNSYSGLFDHLQPPLALACLGSLPALMIPAIRSWVLVPWMALLLLSLPMTVLLSNRTRRTQALGYPLFSAWRALPRGIGMIWGLSSLLRRSPRR